MAYDDWILNDSKIEDSEEREMKDMEYLQERERLGGKGITMNVRRGVSREEPISAYACAGSEIHGVANDEEER